MKQKIRDFLAYRTASWMRHFVHDPKYFEQWQAFGFHVTPVHFYSALPDTREIEGKVFDQPSEMVGISIDETRQLELLAQIAENYEAEYSKLPNGKPIDDCQFYFGNSSLESVDAEILYSLIRIGKPRRMVEIGSGFSTLLALQALELNANESATCEFTAIEPFPPHFLGKLSSTVPFRLIEKKVQDVALTEFESLEAGDILFIDSAHVSKIGSDVNFEFLEVLPRLKKGVLVHVHDIFLPFEYPREWVMRHHRFWTEQYLLHAFLIGNRDFEVAWAGAWMNHRHPRLLQDAFPSYLPNQTAPASFWLRRIS